MSWMNLKTLFKRNIVQQESECAFLPRYRVYRKSGMALNHRLLERYSDRKTYLNCAMILGMRGPNDSIVVNREEDTSALMDFALHERHSREKNIIAQAVEEKFWQDETEQEILEACLSAHTSLFKIVNILRNENQIVLHDLLNKRENIKLVDINFSQTGSPGILLFTRVVSFPEFCMTSGLSFGFPERLEEELVKTYKKTMRHLEYRTESIQRFVFFFNASQEMGIRIKYL